MNRIHSTWLAGLVVVVLGGGAGAATITWNGNGTNATWTTVGNWSSGGLPGAGDDVVFASGLSSGNTVSLSATNAARAVNSLTFDTGSWSVTNSTNFSLTGGYLTLTSGAINRTTTSYGTQLIAGSVTNITLGGSVTNAVWNIGGSGSLTDWAPVAETYVGTAFTKTGAGTLIFANNTQSNGWTGNSYLLAGTVDVSITNGFGAGATIYLGDTSGAYWAKLAGVNLTLTNAINVQAGNVGLAILGAYHSTTNSGAVYSGNVSLNQTLYVAPDLSNAGVNLSGTITGSGGLVLAGAPVFYTEGYDPLGATPSAVSLSTNILSGTSSNTYSGTTTVYQGILYLGKSAGSSAVGTNLVVGTRTGLQNAPGNATNAGSLAAGAFYGYGSGTVLWLASDQIPDSANLTVLANSTASLGSTLAGANPVNETLNNLTIAGGSLVLLGSNWTGAGTRNYASSTFGNGNLNILGNLDFSDGAQLYANTASVTNSTNGLTSRIGLYGNFISDATAQPTTNRFMLPNSYPYPDSGTVALELVGSGMHLFNIGTNAYTYLTPQGAGQVEGAGGIEKTGAGILAMGATNGYYQFTGGIQVDAGVLAITAGAQGLLPFYGQGGIALNGGELRLTAGTSQNVTTNLTVSANSTISSLSSQTFNFTTGITTGSSVNNLTFNYNGGNASSQINVTNLNLSGSTGVVTLTVIGTGASGGGGGQVNVTNITSSQGFTLNGGGSLYVYGNNNATLTGTITINGGTLYASSSNVVYNPDLELGNTNNVVVLNGGRLDFFGVSGQIGAPSGTNGSFSFNHPIQVTSNGGVIAHYNANTLYLGMPNEISGNGPLYLEGANLFFEGGAQPNFTNALYLRGTVNFYTNAAFPNATAVTMQGQSGNVAVGTSNAWGSAPLTVDGGMYTGPGDSPGSGFSSAFGTTGAVNVTNGGEVILSASSTGRGVNDGTLTVGAFSTIAGTTAQLATFTRGSNILLAANSIVAVTASTANAGINNLGTSADLLFGLDYGNTTLFTASLTVGAGTPWAGVAASRLTGGIGYAAYRYGPATLTINSEVSLVGFEAATTSLGFLTSTNNPTNTQYYFTTNAPAANYNSSNAMTDASWFTRNAWLELDGVSIASSGGPYPVDLYGPVAFNQLGANYAGVSQFNVQNGALVALGDTNTVGGGLMGGIPFVINAGGRLYVNLSNSIDGNLTIKNGGMLEIGSFGGASSGLAALGFVNTGAGATGLNGSGVISRDTNTSSVIVSLNGSGALTGSQLTPAFFQAGDILRLNTNSQGEFVGLWQVSPAATFELMSGSRSLTLSTNFTLNGGTIANFTNAATLLSATNGSSAANNSLVIGANGARFAATTTTTLTISVTQTTASSGNSPVIYINSTNPIDGLSRSGTCSFATNFFVTNATLDVQAGTLVSGFAGAFNVPSIILRNNAGIYVTAAQATAAGSSLTIGSTATDNVGLATGGSGVWTLGYQNQLQGPGTLWLDGISGGMSIGSTTTGVSNPNFSGTIVVRNGNGIALNLYMSTNSGTGPANSPIGSGSLVFQNNTSGIQPFAIPVIDIYGGTGESFTNSITFNGNGEILWDGNTGGPMGGVLYLGAPLTIGPYTAYFTAGHQDNAVFGPVTFTGNATLWPSGSGPVTLGAFNDQGVSRTVTNEGATDLILNAPAASFIAASTFVADDGRTILTAANALGVGQVIINNGAGVYTAGTNANQLNGATVTLNNGALSSLVFNTSQSAVGGILAHVGLVTLNNVAVTAGNVAVLAGAQINANGHASLTVNTNLSGTGQITGTVSLAGTASLSPGTAAGPGTLYTENLVLGSLNQLIYRLGLPGVAGGASNDLTVVNGGLTLAGLLTVSPNGFGGVGTYSLFDYTGSLTNNTLTVNSMPNGYVGFISLATSGQVNLLVTNSGAPMVWQGTTDNNWDFATTNWNNPAVVYADNNVTILDDTGTNTAINLSVVATPLSLTVSNNVLAYSISGSGSINGPTSLVKYGSATLTLATSNGYTGGTKVKGGTVVVNTNNALGSGAVTVGDTSGTASASLLVGLDQITIAPNITVQSGSSGTATLGGANTSGTGIFTGTVTLQEALTLTAAGGGTVDFQGPMNNSLGQTLTKVGAGTVILSGPQTSGAGAALQVQAGTLNLNANGGANLAVSTTNAGSTLNFGANQTLNSIDVGDNTVVSMTNYTVSAGNVVVRGGAQVQGGGTSLLTVSGTLSGTGTIIGPTTLTNAATLSPGISGAGTLTVGTLTLNNLTALTWDLAATNTVGSGINDLVEVNGSLTLDGNLTINGAVLANGSYRLFDYTGSLINDTLNLVSAMPAGQTATIDLSVANQVNLLVFTTTNLVWRGTTDNNWNFATANWNSPGVVYNNNTDTVLDDTGTNTAINLSVVVTPLSLTVSNNLVAYSISGSGSINGSTSLVKNGTNTLTLSTSNGYTGGTTINAGLVKFTQAAALPPTGAVTVGNGGTLAVNVGGTGEFSNATSGVGSLGNVISAPTWAVGSTLGVDTTNAGGSLTYTGVIAGNMGLNKLGNGTLLLTAAPTYAGATTVTAGTLQTPQIANNNSLTIASGAKVVLTTNGGLNPNASVVSSLAIAGTLDLGDNGLIVTGATAGTESTVQALIASGFNGGDWQGTGITSSTVAAHSTSMTIAYDFASNIHLTFSGGFATWGGQSISSTNASTDLLVMPTLIGDANMDGYVNFVDVTEMIPNLGSTPGQTWGGGDFSGDGYVNFVDVTELIPNLGGSVSVLSPDVVVGSSSVTVTPEPASLVLLALGGLLILPRRRGRNARA